MRILVFGDSITQGFFDEIRSGWVSRLSAYAMKQTLDTDFASDVNIFNHGISADCTNRVLERFDNEAIPRIANREAGIIFSIGINDTQRYIAENNRYKTNPEQFEQNVVTLVDKARAYTDTIIVLGILPIIESKVQPMPWASDRSHFESDVVQYNQILQTVCATKDIVFVDMKSIFNGDDVMYLDDGIHPNAEGHRLIFERVKEVLEKEGIL